jgi:anaerobic selenocysteine-containing dehydrogenase
MPVHVPEVEGLSGVDESSPYPLQVFSAATHYFIGSTFQHVEHLQNMLSRPTFELSPHDANKRSIAEGDYCRLFNDRGEVFGHAHIVKGLRPGVLGAPKQLQGSKMKNGFNLNALTSQREADMGRGPVYYSTLAEIEKADASLA